MRSVSIWQEMAAERDEAHRKHGDKSMEAKPWDHMQRLRILVEEVGEVARAFNEYDLGNATLFETIAAVRKELIQVGAMSGAWADAVPPMMPQPLNSDPINRPSGQSAEPINGTPRPEDVLRKYAQAIERIKAMHVITDANHAGGDWCRHDGFSWPCPTIQVLEDLS